MRGLGKKLVYELVIGKWDRHGSGGFGSKPVKGFPKPFFLLVVAKESKGRLRIIDSHVDTVASLLFAFPDPFIEVVFILD